MPRIERAGAKEIREWCWEMWSFEEATRKGIFEQKTSERRGKEVRMRGGREGISDRGCSRWKGSVTEGRGGTA